MHSPLQQHVHSNSTGIFTYAILTSTLLIGIPHMVLIFYICYQLAKKAGITQCLTKNHTTFRRLKRCVLAITNQAKTDLEAESDTSSLPDRLINPEEYEPELHTSEERTAAEPTEIHSEDPRRLTPTYTYGSIN